MTTQTMPRTRLKTFIRRRWWVLAVAGAVVVGAAATGVALAGGASTNPGMHVRGTLTLDDPDAGFGVYTYACAGSGGYSDITEGAQVTITGPDGTVLAVGSLGPGQTTHANACRFPFSVEDVPTGHGLYGIQVSHRGIITYPESQLGTVTNGPALTLG